MEPYLISAIGVLGSCIAVLFGLLKASGKATERRLLDCEEDRDDLWRMIRGIATSALEKDPTERKKTMEVIEETAAAKVEHRHAKPPSDPPTLATT